MSAELQIYAMPLAGENGVVAARRQAKRIAELVGFDGGDQTRIATAVSEIARNAYEYAGGGAVSFLLRNSGTNRQQRLLIRISDSGPGIADIDEAMQRGGRAKLGANLGIVGAKRLVDNVLITSQIGNGTLVELEKALPRRSAAVNGDQLKSMIAQLTREVDLEPLAVMSEQNRELAHSLEEVRSRQEELAEVNRELEETNRGVVALYAELEAQAEQLRGASELKTRFLSNVSHEFRTPVNSILALTRLLLDRVDGLLSEEQERQVNYIRKSAENLSELVNDLLDLAKVEAGKIEVKPSSFKIGEVFGGLRGVLRPLRANEAVNLIFEEPSPDTPDLFTDETKIAQILRNFISNALKFTLKGEVRVIARYDPAKDQFDISISDTGVGIAPNDLTRIFEEFSQIDNPLQKATKGTGLGLNLSQRLAELLGGKITVESRLGVGSTFTLSTPRTYRRGGPDTGGAAAAKSANGGSRLLLIDDEESFRYVLREMINGRRGKGAMLDIVEAADGGEGLALARQEPKPSLILLDLQMPRIDGYAFLQLAESDPSLADVPVVVISSSSESKDNPRLARASAVFWKPALLAEGLPEGLRQFIDGVVG
jgi:signal transduction histidine kinase